MVTRLIGLCCALIAFNAWYIVSPVSAQDAETKRPNILLIVADDAGFGDFGFSGSISRTTNIDRLAKEGMAFTRFHASPVCSVTRGMLLTGNNPIEIGSGCV